MHQSTNTAALEFQVRCFLTLTVTETDLIAQVTIENTSPQPLPVLQWNVPPDGVMSQDLFEVHHEGILLPYIGKTVKRYSPSKSDYLTLQPGARVTATIPLKQGYHIREPGRYTIRYRALNPLPGFTKPEELFSNLVAIRVQPWAVEELYIHCALHVVVTDTDIVATVTLENASQHRPMQVLQEDLPVDGNLTKPLFLVERNGIKVPYMGKLTKPSAAKRAEYFTLRPGEETTATMPLQERYDFRQPGQYTVRYNTFLVEPKTLEVIAVTSNPVSIDIR